MSFWLEIGKFICDWVYSITMTGSMTQLELRAKIEKELDEIKAMLPTLSDHKLAGLEVRFSTELVFMSIMGVSEYVVEYMVDMIQTIQAEIESRE